MAERVTPSRATSPGSRHAPRSRVAHVMTSGKASPLPTPRSLGSTGWGGRMGTRFEGQSTPSWRVGGGFHANAGPSTGYARVSAASPSLHAMSEPSAARTPRPSRRAKIAGYGALPRNSCHYLPGEDDSGGRAASVTGSTGGGTPGPRSKPQHQYAGPERLVSPSQLPSTFGPAHSITRRLHDVEVGSTTEDLGLPPKHPSTHQQTVTRTIHAEDLTDPDDDDRAVSLSSSYFFAGSAAGGGGGRLPRGGDLVGQSPLTVGNSFTSPGLPPTVDFDAFFEPTGRSSGSPVVTSSSVDAALHNTRIYKAKSASVVRVPTAGTGSGRRSGRSKSRRRRDPDSSSSSSSNPRKSALNSASRRSDGSRVAATASTAWRRRSRQSRFAGYSLQQAVALVMLLGLVASVPAYISYGKHVSGLGGRGSGRGGGGTVVGVPKSPNVVLFFPDDMGYNDLTYHNDGITRPYETSNIDALALKGVRLATYYTAPTCSPARCALLTGRYMMRSGCQHEDFENNVPSGVPLTETFMPQYLKQAGYYTIMLGKWHLGMFTKYHLPTSRGFDEFRGFLGGGEDHFDHDDDDVYDWWSNTSIDYSAQGTYATYILNKTLQNFFATRAQKLQPWFAYIPTQAPHGPYEAPNKWKSKITYDMGDDEDGEGVAWAAMMLMLDDFVGSTVSGLKKYNMHDNTLVIFAGDHGAPENEPDWDGNAGRDYPFRGGKSELWEGGVRVPAFMYAPFIPTAWQGRTVDGITSVVDWLPTIASLAGVDTSGGNALDGVDLTKVIWGGGSQDDLYSREYLVNVDQLCVNDDDWDSPNAALRYGQYKLVADCVSSSGTFKGTTRLYDLSSDPGEEYNLLSDSSFTSSNSQLISTIEGRLAYYASVAATPHQNDAPYFDDDYFCADCQKGCPSSNGYWEPFYTLDAEYVGDQTECEQNQEMDMDDEDMDE